MQGCLLKGLRHAMQFCKLLLFEGHGLMRRKDLAGKLVGALAHILSTHLALELSPFQATGEAGLPLVLFEATQGVWMG